MSEEKKVDETWKEKAHLPNEQVKEEIISKDASQNDLMPEPSFAMLTSSLAIQATIALGEVENPITNKKETSIGQAKYLIDTLGMLQEKTKNNLTKEEADLLENMLYQLRTLFLEKSNSPQLKK